MKLFKKSTIITSIFMAIIFCFSFLMLDFTDTKQSIETRDIDVNEIGTLSYEEEVEKILKSFDDYSVNNNDSQIVFEAVTDISDLDFSGVQYLSTTANTTTKKYRTNLDVENEKFEIITEYIQDDMVVYTETMETVPYYDEYDDDYYIDMPDGTVVSVAETFETENIDECSVVLLTLGMSLTAVEIAVLLAAVVIVAAPVITQVVTVVVTTVVTWVRSFWRWFKSLWTKKTTTVVTTTTTITLSYTITISDVKVEAKPYTKTMELENDKYYVAIADSDDGLLYVASQPVEDVVALAILTKSTYVKSAHEGSNKFFVISIYSPDPTGKAACAIATEAGKLLGSEGAVHHEARKISYYNHYHPGVEYTSLSHPHAFYGEPKPAD